MPKKPHRKPSLSRETKLFNVRLPTSLLDEMRTFVLEEVDQYGERRFRSLSHFAEESFVKNLPRSRVAHRSTT